MLISIIMDNYNYAKYLPQAIDSVLVQTYKNFELIVVDDGSTDNSLKIIEEYSAKDTRIKPIFKPNGGQASAFNEGFKASRGEIICFLDSDDCFVPDKLETIAKLHGDGYAYIYSDNQSINESNESIKDSIKRYRYDGQNLFLVYYMSKYPGNVTSTISLTRELAMRIFPIPHEQKWRIQADDPIVFQASMMGRAKFLDKKIALYRIHQNNAHYGKPKSPDYLYELLQKRNEIKDIALAKMGISMTFLKNPYNLVAEFKTHRVLDYNLLKLYLKLLFFEMDLSFLKKIETTVDLLKDFYKKREQ